MFRIVPQLTVSDVARSVAFYTEHLGFTIGQEDPPGEPDFVSLDREEASLFLVSQDSREEQYQIDDLAAHKRGVGVKLFLEVDSASLVCERLRSAGVPILRELARSEAEDYAEFAVVDPDGYEIGIYS
jgi:catechol 2,3-dioxygenase-like lactoylglutathione lyase family enzyme